MIRSKLGDSDGFRTQDSPRIRVFCQHPDFRKSLSSLPLAKELYLLG